MVVTNRRRDRARRSACCATGAQETKYHHVLKGFNYRMEGLQGAILRVKLRHLDALDRRAPRACRRLRPPARRQRRRACRSEARLRAARLSRLRGPHARPRRRCERTLKRMASRPASTIPCRCTCSRRTPTSGYGAGDFPRIRARRQRGAVAADVPGADAHGASSWSPPRSGAGVVCPLKPAAPHRAGRSRPQDSVAEPSGVRRARWRRGCRRSYRCDGLVELYSRHHARRRSRSTR